MGPGQPQPLGMPAPQPSQPGLNPPQDPQGQDLLSLLQHQHRLRHGGHFPGGPTPPHAPPAAAAGPYKAGPGHAPIGQIANGQAPYVSPHNHFEAFGQSEPKLPPPQALPGYPGGLPVQANGSGEGLGRGAMAGPPGAQGPGGVFGQPGGNLAQLFQAAQLQVSTPALRDSEDSPPEPALCYYFGISSKPHCVLAVRGSFKPAAKACMTSWQWTLGAPGKPCHSHLCSCSGLLLQ